MGNEANTSTCCNRLLEVKVALSVLIRFYSGESILEIVAFDPLPIAKKCVFFNGVFIPFQEFDHRE